MKTPRSVGGWGNDRLRDDGAFPGRRTGAMVGGDGRSCELKHQSIRAGYVISRGLERARCTAEFFNAVRLFPTET